METAKGSIIPASADSNATGTVQLGNTNPANTASIADLIASGERKRVPMSTAKRKLEAPEIPGHSLYWFLERNIKAALDGGYEFVDSQETVLNQHGLATAASVSGNTDLGSRVSIATTGADGPERLYLMKIRLEWFQEDQRALQETNARILSAIFRDDFTFDEANGREGGPLGRDPSTYFHESNSMIAGKKALLARRRRAKV